MTGNLYNKIWRENILIVRIIEQINLYLKSLIKLQKHLKLQAKLLDMGSNYDLHNLR